MSTRDTSPPLLGEMTTEEFRQRLAGLIDPAEQLDLTDRETVRLTAVDFVACLPMIYGEELKTGGEATKAYKEFRLKLWDRIGSGLQTAFAKTVGDDVEFFVSEVCRHIMAGSAVTRCDELFAVVSKVLTWETEQREAWIRRLSTHLPMVLQLAKAAWETTKAERKAGAK